MHLEQILVGPMAIFAYLIGCEETKRAALIDPAWDEERLVDRAGSLGLEIDLIINTHAHPDHTSGNKNVKSLTGAKIVIGREDADYLTSDRAAAMGFTPSPPADMTVGDGDVIKIGRLELKVLATPGHSPGGCCFYIDGNVFTGDTLFVGAVGRTDLPGASLDQLMASIRDKLLTLPGETVVWPGHHYGPSPSSTIDQERRTNPFITDFVNP